MEVLNLTCKAQFSDSCESWDGFRHQLYAATEEPFKDKIVKLTGVVYYARIRIVREKIETVDRPNCKEFALTTPLLQIPYQ